jgi:hypothetical protein
VRAQLAVVPEPLRAAGARKVLLIGVRGEVLLQVLLRRESALAERAREAIDAAVPPNVLVVAEFRAQRLCADRALPHGQLLKERRAQALVQKYNVKAETQTNGFFSMLFKLSQSISYMY